jgi:hypothetical protein
MLLGVEPLVVGVGITLVGAEGAPKMIEERGTAVGFSDINEKAWVKRWSRRVGVAWEGVHERKGMQEREGG